MFNKILTFIFSKFFSFIFFWANFFLKSEVLHIDWNFIRGYIAMCLLRLWCLFFQNFYHSYFWANLVPKSEVIQINWNFVQGYIAICLLQFWCLSFSKFLSVKLFWANLISKAEVLQNWLKFGSEVHYYMLITILMFIFSKVFHSSWCQIWFCPNWLESSICVY